MKVYFKNMLQGYRGTCDGLIYFYNPRLNRILVRQYVKPRPNHNNRRFAAIARKLKAIAPSEAFKTDLSVYTDIYSRRLRRNGASLSNWYNAYIKLMYALQAAEPSVDLEFIERVHIEANDYPCRSVKRAVEAGLLDSVPGYELLDKLM